MTMWWLRRRNAQRTRRDVEAIDTHEVRVVPWERKGDGDAELRLHIREPQQWHVPREGRARTNFAEMAPQAVLYAMQRYASNTPGIARVDGASHHRGVPSRRLRRCTCV